MEMSDQPHAHAVLSPGKNHDTHRIEGWVGPTDGLSVMKARKISLPCRNSSPSFFMLLAQLLY